MHRQIVDYEAKAVAIRMNVSDGRPPTGRISYIWSTRAVVVGHLLHIYDVQVSWI